MNKSLFSNGICTNEKQTMWCPDSPEGNKCRKPNRGWDFNIALSVVGRTTGQKIRTVEQLCTRYEGLIHTLEINLDFYKQCSSRLYHSISMHSNILKPKYHVRDYKLVHCFWKTIKFYKESAIQWLYIVWKKWLWNCSIVLCHWLGHLNNRNGTL